METPISSEAREGQVCTTPDTSKDQARPEEHSKRGKRPVRARKTSNTADLIRAFGVANIPLTALNIRGLVEYLQANVNDLAAPSSSDQLKRCYQKYMSKELVSPNFCSVQGCSTWSHTDHKYTIFPFPDCKESVKLWKQALGLSKVRKMQGVCELHFDEDFLIRESRDQRVTLMPGAVPKKFQGSAIRPLLTINHCRMCGLSVKYPMTSTVTGLQMNLRLRPVLEMCLELNDAPHRLLPDAICDGCTKMVRFVGKYAESCWDAQQQLLGHYAGGMGRKVQPWKRVYQYLEDPEIADTEVSDPSPSAQVVVLTVEELATEAARVEALEVIPLKSDPEFDAPKPISVKAEALDNCNSGSTASSTNDENAHDSSNQEPPLKKAKPKGKQIDMSSGRYKKYECVTCWQRLASQAELNVHTRKHERERIEGKSTTDVVLTSWLIDTIKCLQCRKKFKTAEELKAHTSQEHNYEVYCPVCGIRFRSKDVLEQHRKRARRCIMQNAEKVQ